MLNNNQLIAVQLVAQGKTGKFISQHLNVAEETISRWRKKPEFIASVNVLLNQLRDTLIIFYFKLFDTKIDTFHEK